MKRYPRIPIWLVAPLALLRMAWGILTNPERAWMIALSFDDLGNVATDILSIVDRRANATTASAVLLDV